MATTTITDSSAYLGNVGPYPTAPDVTHEAFIQHMIDIGQLDPRWRSKWLYHLTTDDPAPLGVDWNQWRSQRALYDQWSKNLTNKYAADVKTWEAAHNSPLSQSELLESAGYNRNWLQGASGSQVQASDYMPTPSDNAPRTSPLQQFGAMSDLLLKSMQAVMGIRQQQADIDLKEAQANRIDTMIPYDMVQAYFRGLEGKNKWYGPSDPGTADYFQVGRDSRGNYQGITFYGTGYDNHGMRLMSQVETMNSLRAQLMMLSREQQGFILSKLLPFQDDMNKLLMKAQETSLTFAEWDAEVRKAAQSKLVEYAGKGVEQQYILNYVNAGLNAIRTIGGLIIGAKGLNLKFKDFGLDWLDKTGEILPGMPGN